MTRDPRHRASAWCSACRWPGCWPGSASRAGGCVRALVTVPLVLPPVVGGVALLLALRPAAGWSASGWTRAFGITLPFTTAGGGGRRDVRGDAVPGHQRRGRAARRRRRATRRPRPRSAPAGGRRSAGSPCRWSRPGVAAGAVLCWARALGEFGATITFAGNFPGRTQTMPLAVYLALETDPDGGDRAQPGAAASSRWPSWSACATAGCSAGVTGREPRRAPRRRSAGSFRLDVELSRRRRRGASPCSAPTAPARPPRCGPWPGCCRSTGGHIALDGDGLDDRRPARARPSSGRSAWSSRTTCSSRT